MHRLQVVGESKLDFRVKPGHRVPVSKEAWLVTPPNRHRSLSDPLSEFISH